MARFVGFHGNDVVAERDVIYDKPPHGSTRVRYRFRLVRETTKYEPDPSEMPSYPWKLAEIRVAESAPAALPPSDDGK
jgi:hypothetical protein